MLLIIIWTHKRHPIAHPHGRALGCSLWVFFMKLTILSGVHFIYFHRCFSLPICAIDHNLNSQKTSYISPSRASYRVFLVSIFYKIDHIIRVHLIYFHRWFSLPICPCLPWLYVYCVVGWLRKLALWRKQTLQSRAKPSRCCFFRKTWWCWHGFCMLIYSTVLFGI